MNMGPKNGHAHWPKLTAGNYIQLAMMIGLGLMAWQGLKGAVEQIVEREGEHYLLLRGNIEDIESDIERLTDKIDNHLFDQNLHRRP